MEPLSVLLCQVLLYQVRAAEVARDAANNELLRVASRAAASEAGAQRCGQLQEELKVRWYRLYLRTLTWRFQGSDTKASSGMRDCRQQITTALLT